MGVVYELRQVASHWQVGKLHPALAEGIDQVSPARLFFGFPLAVRVVLQAKGYRGLEAHGFCVRKVYARVTLGFGHRSRFRPKKQRSQA